MGFEIFHCIFRFLPTVLVCPPWSMCCGYREACGKRRLVVTQTLYSWFMNRDIDSTGKGRTGSYAETRYLQMYWLDRGGIYGREVDVDRSRVRHSRRRYFRSAQLCLDLIHLLRICDARCAGCEYSIVDILLMSRSRSQLLIII